VARSRWVPRLLLGAGAIALSAAIVSISVGTGGPKVIKLRGADRVQQLVGGIPQDGAEIGPATAPVTISVFNDLQCSTCDDYQLRIVDRLIEEYARTGKARLVFRHYSLGQAETTKAAFAATAAAEQDREWHFVELFLRNQDAAPAGTVSDRFLNNLGNAITELDLDTWRRQMESPRVRARVEADGELAASYGLRVNAPSVVVQGPGGSQVLQDAPSRRQIEDAVAAVRSP
jgi:protein-disulfide isomerase